MLTGQRLFYPRGLAAPASLVEPASSGDGLTARLGALADVFDLFMRTADGKAPKPGSLTAFCAELTSRLPSAPDQDRARAAVGRLTDINRIRNGDCTPTPPTGLNPSGASASRRATCQPSNETAFALPPSRPCT